MGIENSRKCKLTQSGKKTDSWGIGQTGGEGDSKAQSTLGHRLISRGPLRGAHMSTHTGV